MNKRLLIITEQNVAQDGITWQGGGQISTICASWGRRTVASSSKREETTGRVDHRCKVGKGLVFLAFSSKARTIANDVQTFLSSRGVSVLNWELDFSPGPSIMEELLEASKKCLGAIMLLTKDDELTTLGNWAPRDNVIFELGFFMREKGKDRVLVIREGDAKLPADIGGASVRIA